MEAAEVIDVQEGARHFSRLVERAEHGEDIVIARSGKPVVRLVPFYVYDPRPREPGSMRGLIAVRDDFEAPLADEILDAFEGGHR